MSFQFDPDAYGPEIAAILGGLPPSPLGPGTPHSAHRPLLSGLKLPAACQSGLWLRCNYLNDSHTISQDLHTAEGSFWHAIMHRREPDAWNSKYWWRQVGKHPVLDQLRAECPEYRTPEAFVDFCEKHRGSGSPGEHRAVEVQNLEWQLLFDHCYRMGVAPA